MTEQQLRMEVAGTINGWVGATKGSAKHLEILEIYNNHRPLARGYKVKVTDAYCATTVSAAYIKVGIAEYTGTECGVGKYVQDAQKRGIWVENDAHTPKIGDACVYDWDDNGEGDNTGAGDHIGIVTQVGNGSFVVTEGNMSGGKVGKRTMAINGRYIRGFICPGFAAIAAKMGGTKPTAPTAPEAPTAARSYTVKPGDTLGKIARENGTTVDDLVAINGIKNKNVIHVGQVIYLTPVAAACGKLAKLGVINSPDLWISNAESGKVEYLGALLVKAAEVITKAGTRTKTWEDGLAALVAAGVVNTPEYWRNNIFTLPNLGALMCALGGAKMRRKK